MIVKWPVSLALMSLTNSSRSTIYRWSFVRIKWNRMGTNTITMAKSWPCSVRRIIVAVRIGALSYAGLSSADKRRDEAFEYLVFLFRDLSGTTTRRNRGSSHSKRKGWKWKSWVSANSKMPTVRRRSAPRIDSLRVTLFEDPAYHSLIEKIMTNKSLLMREFEKADPTKTGRTQHSRGIQSKQTNSIISPLDHLSLTVWAEIMSNVLQLDLPWLILRAKLVKEDEKGILYKTMFTDYILDNSKFQMVRQIFLGRTHSPVVLLRLLS